MPARPLFALFAGLALGTTGTYLLTRAAAPFPSALLATRHPIPSTSSAAPALILPPRLAPDEAAAAITAWLALGAPTDGSAPADFPRQASALRALLTVLPDEAFPLLLNPLIARTNKTNSNLRATAFHVWTERAPAAAAAWVAANPAGNSFSKATRRGFARKAILAWARLDFDAAYAWCLDHPESERPDQFPGQLLGQLFATEPARALDLARARGEDFVRANQKVFFETWSKHDPASALQSLGAGLLKTDPYSWPFQAAVRDWLARDAGASLAWLLDADHVSPDDARSVLDQTIRTVSEDFKNPRGLADALLSRGDLPDQFGRVAYLLKHWAAKDAPAALAWLDALPDAEERVNLLQRTLQSDYGSAADALNHLPLALHLPPGDTRDKKLAAILACWSRADPDAALAWIQSRDDPGLALAAARIQGNLLAKLAATDPAAAFDGWESLPDGEAKSAATTAIAAVVADRDPAAAARWLGQQTDYLDDHQNNAQVEAIIHAWSQKDPVAALQWAETLPARERIRAINALNGRWHDDHPDRAAHAEVLARLADPQLRATVLGQHLQDWLKSDLHAARDWIDTHPVLTPEQAAKLLAAASATTP